jgi:hypothetical protein
MKRWLTFVSALALAVALGGVFSRIPRALSEVEAFKVKEVRLRGERFLTLDAAVETLALPDNASVWDDTRILEARLAAHPLVEEASVHRRFPSTLLLRVREVEPVGLVPLPTLKAVDASGHILPIDPLAHRLDLPIMLVEGSDGSEPPSPSGLRILASEIQRLAMGDPELASTLSDIALNPRGDVTARLSDPPVNLQFRPGIRNGRIRTGLRVLEMAREQVQIGQAVDLDLRYAGQVVVRFPGTVGN